MVSERSDLILDESEAEFQRAWDAADWMFKNDRQDAKYFFLLGQRVEKVKRLEAAKTELGRLREGINNV
jgi:hypothetical protein